MKPQIRYVVGDRRKKPIPIIPHIIIGDIEFVATDSTTMRDAQEVCRALVADPHQIDEQYTKKYHEEVDISDIKQYDE